MFKLLFCKWSPVGNVCSSAHGRSIHSSASLGWALGHQLLCSLVPQPSPPSSSTFPGPLFHSPLVEVWAQAQGRSGSLACIYSMLVWGMVAAACPGLAVPQCTQGGREDYVGRTSCPYPATEVLISWRLSPPANVGYSRKSVGRGNAWFEFCQWPKHGLSVLRPMGGGLGSCQVLYAIWTKDLYFHFVLDSENYIAGPDCKIFICGTALSSVSQVVYLPAC
jgi:hypothetical protein